MEQVHVQRFVLMEAPVPSSARQPRRPRFKAQRATFAGAIHAGHPPVYIGAYAHRMRVTGMTLEF